MTESNSFYGLLNTVSVKSIKLGPKKLEGSIIENIITTLKNNLCSATSSKIKHQIKIF